MKLYQFIILFTLSIFNFAQNKALEKQWNLINKELNDGQFTSVKPQIVTLKNNAQKLNAEEDYLKALFYEAKINILTTDETDDVNFIFKTFSDEIKGKSKVRNAIVNLYLAKLYQLYLDENSYIINSRTALENQESDDVRFWTTDIFTNKISQLYKKALQHKPELLKINANNWKLLLSDADFDLIDFERNVEVNPSIYDIIAKDYINYLVRYKKDKEANKFLEELIKINKEKGNLNAVLFYENILLDKSNVDFSSSEYINQKEDLAAKYFNQAWYSTVIYESLVNKLRNLNTDKKENLLKIFEIENKLKAKYPDFQATKSVIKIGDDIRQKTYNITVDEFVSPNENIPTNVSYKNIDKLYVRVYRFNDKIKEPYFIYNLIGYDNELSLKAEKFLKSLKIEQEYTIDLKHFDDYQNHSTIVKMNPLPIGNFIILYSSEPEFNLKSKVNPVIFNRLSATKYVISSNNNKLYVQDRNSGKPEVKKEVEVYNNYDEKLSTYTSNKYGIVKLDFTSANISFRVKGDDAIFKNYLYNRNDTDYTRQNKDVLAKILTDRAIYRPGQTVYFKAITYAMSDKQYNVVSDLKVNVILRDVNSKEIAKIEGITNEYGSFSGQFQIPSSVLTGNFTISLIPIGRDYYSQLGNQWIKVEEYKRPNFEVKIQENKGIYQFNDQVDVEGIAEAFSGAKIDNATVKYRVYREELYWFWPWYRTINNGSKQDEEIAYGETKTDSEGKFAFNFTAKPLADKQDYARLYNYKIEVNVTDINGETQTTVSTLKVSDNRYVVKVLLPNKVEASALNNFNVSVANINDVKQNVKGKVEIYTLQSPDRVLRKSNFKTTYNYYSKEEFIKLFPHQPYGDEQNPKDWKIDKKVFEASFDTEKSTLIQFLNSNKLEENYYLIKTIVDDEKGETESENLIYVINPKKLNNYTLLSVVADKDVYQVGETAKVTFNSSLKSGYVYYQIRNGKEIIKEGVLEIKKSNTIQIPITKDALGGIGVSYFIEKYNDLLVRQIRLDVPFPAKDLNVTTEVFRDKLKPGEQEKWKIKISGLNKEKISAEVLATMYDASLDQFVGHNLSFNPNTFGQYYFMNPFNYLEGGFKTSHSSYLVSRYDGNYYRNNYNGLNFSMFDFTFNTYYNRNRIMYKSSADNSALMLEEAVIAPMPSAKAEAKFVERVAGNEIAGVSSNSTQIPEEKEHTENQLNKVIARKVFEETAFFYPNLQTDSEGNISIEFTAPESLTEWKLMTLAHTKDLSTGYLERRAKTQKELMIVPNLPRFLREGDQIKISAKINNLSDNMLNGTAKLMLFDAFTMQPIDAQFGLNQQNVKFTTVKGNSAEVSWEINVPKNIQAVVYRVVAAAGNFTDGEESALPILTNRMLVTESMPVYIKENQKKSFQFKNLVSNQSTTLDHYKLTFEMTTNPLWYAIFALPYLREYPYECSEQVFSRLYGNMVSEKIVSSNPKIKAVFDEWNKNGALKSKLEVNEELKNIILEETPWLRNAESESQQQHQIATLFQLNQMQNEMRSAFTKLSAKQNSNGGFAWFEGGATNEYITTYIVSGFGNLKRMDVNFKSFGIDANSLINSAISYIDDVNLKRYKEFKSKQKEFTDIVYSDGIHYLYARSFFLDQFPMSKEVEEMKNVMLKNLNAKKLDLSLQQKAMAALVLNRYGLQSAAKILLNSVKESAVKSDEMGMYWKSNQPGWYWYQAPVETQASLIEAFDEVLHDEESVEEMKVWLLKNKQTNQWNSTKATTQAVYALMNTGKSWIDAEKGITVKIADKSFDLVKDAQAGSGYVKEVWNETDISPDLGKVDIDKTSPGVAWGVMYWQYFEDLDKIKSAETGIKFNKKLYLKQNTANGPIFREITTKTPIKVGDIVTVRLEISIDRNMQFIHIKDMRASGFEPVNVLSGYKWGKEFGYYESTRDVATNFFVDNMRKGTYVFEYDLKANNAGNFSNGITSMQNMYAPELSAHSEGIRVEIK